MSNTIIEIPIKDTDEVVEVDVSELPEASEIISILKEEQSPRDLYYRFAIEYYKLGSTDAFLELLKESLEPGVPDGKNYTSAIPVHNALAAYYMSKARNMPSERSEMYFKATQSYNEADKIDHDNQMTWLGKAWLQLSQGKYDQSLYLYRILLDKNPKNIAALMGKAAVLFNTNKFGDALNVYQTVLKLKPNLMPDPRIGNPEAGAENKAIYAMERAHRLDGNNVEVLAYLASMYYNMAKKDPKSEEAKASLLKSLEHVKQAQALNKNHPLVLLHLSEIMYQKNQLEKSKKCALDVLESDPVAPKFKAFAGFLAARGFHVQKKYLDAHKYYQMMLKEYPQFPLATFGVAKTHLYKGDLKQSIEFIHKTIKFQQNNVECNKILSFLYAKDYKTRDKAIELLKLNNESHDPDVDCLVKYAELLETSDPLSSAKAYEKAAEIFATRNEVSLYALNNIGALYLNAGNLEDAQKTLDAAKTLCVSLQMNATGEDKLKQEYEMILITVSYNCARLLELLGRFDEADQIYQEILDLHPGYVDALLRRGQMSQQKGKFQDAGDCFKRASSINPKCADAWILLGQMELSKKAYRYSRPYFERVLKQIDSRDVFCLVAVGNDRILAAKAEQKSESRSELFKEAAKFFDKALRYNEFSVYAACGMAIVLAETGNVHEAKDLFALAREANARLMHPQLNLAHAMMELGQYKAALAVYENISKKFPLNDENITIYVGRAYYFLARSEKSAEDMLKCIKLLQQIYHEQPQDYTISYNLALALQQYPQLVCDKPEDQRSLEEIDRAFECLDMAEAMFAQLKQVQGEAHKLGFDPNLAGQREKHCTFVRNTVIRQQQRQRANQELQKEKILELQRLREEEIERQRKAEEEERLRKEEAERKLFEERQGMYEKIREEQKEVAIKVAAAEEKKKQQKKRKGDHEDIGAGSESENNSMASRSRSENPSDKSKKKKKKRLRRNLSDEEQEEVKADADDEMVEHEESEPASTSRRSSTKRYLSAEYVDDSSEDEDEKPPVSEPLKTSDETEPEGDEQMSDNDD